MWEEFHCKSEIERLSIEAELLEHLKSPTQSLADSVFRCYIQHQRLKAVVDYLHRIGSRTKNDRAWTAKLVSDYLFENHDDVSVPIVRRAREIHGINSAGAARRYN